ncbi:zinc knuckle CX2CX4HX4C containing protein [Tanacetum coccineum]
MEKVLEHGSWLIRLVPLILNIWTRTSTLKKDETSLAPVWVKLHDVPIVAYLKTGLSLITTKIGRPIMLDAYTSNICINTWGNNTYARALIEVSAANALLDSLVMAIPIPNVKTRKKKGKKDDGSQAFGGIRLSKPKTNVIWQQKKNEGSKGGSNDASSSGTTIGGDKMPSPTCAKPNLNTSVSNPFDVLNTVEEDANDHNPKVSKPIDSGSSKVDDVKVQEDDSLWKHFQRSKKISSQEDDTDEESEVEEYPLYDTTGISSTGGGFSLEDDDLDCYDGYEAKIYNLSRKSQAFYDNYDICLNSRVRK